MTERRFRIAEIPFVINGDLSDEEMTSMFGEPQPYNLYINYNIKIESGKAFEDDNARTEHISINKCDGRGFYLLSEHGLEMYVNAKELLQRDYNWQFSLFGNKGLLQKYILHILEYKYGRIIFHACAVKCPENGLTVIGLGESGSGKSAFVTAALSDGWELVATEQVILDKDLTIWRGNVYDNMSRMSVEKIRELLTEAKIIPSKRLVEPLGQKVLVDMKEYAVRESHYQMNNTHILMANLNFHGLPSGVKKLDDNDYFLRLLQISSSEKISFPPIVKNRLISINLQGDSNKRQNVIETLLALEVERVVVSGGFNGFLSCIKQFRHKIC